MRLPHAREAAVIRVRRRRDHAGLTPMLERAVSDVMLLPSGVTVTFVVSRLWSYTGCWASGAAQAKKIRTNASAPRNGTCMLATPDCRPCDAQIASQVHGLLQ